MSEVFTKLAPYYDQDVVGNRLDHSQIISQIVPFITSSMLHIADLASGTGCMAGAAHQRWPEASIHCEEPSASMLALLQQKYPHFYTFKCKLEETKIKDKDLVTVAFNSINYVLPENLSIVFEKIRSGMRDKRVFYFDGMTTESAAKLLNGKEELTKVRERGKLAISTTLTATQLENTFTMKDGASEHHVQHLVAEDVYRALLKENRFEIEHIESLEHSLRTAYVCRSK